MSNNNPLTLPIARLRSLGCKVHTVIGHDPITTGRHPDARSRWQYGIVLPEGVTVPDVEDLLWSYNHGWDASVGDKAVAYTFRDGRIMVTATSDPSQTGYRADLRQHRRTTECEVAELLARIATALEPRIA